MLDQSRAEHLALHGVIRDDLRPLLLEQIERAAKTVADADAALENLAERREQTRWYEGRRRAEIDRSIADHRSVRKQWQHKVDWLAADLAEHPEPPEPALWRGRDPLARLDPAAELGRERSRQMNRDDDLGRDLGQ